MHGINMIEIDFLFFLNWLLIMSNSKCADWCFTINNYTETMLEDIK